MGFMDVSGSRGKYVHFMCCRLDFQMSQNVLGVVAGHFNSHRAGKVTINSNY